MALRRRRVGRACCVVALASVLLVVSAFAVGCRQAEVAAARPPIEVEAYRAFHAPVRLTVEPGDTLEIVARRLAGDDWVRWRDALASQIDPRALIPGTDFDGERDFSGNLASLVVTLDQRSQIHFSATASGIDSTRVDRPIESEITRYEGTVESSLFAAVEAAGAGPDLAVRLAEVFQWDIDFFRDLRRGDHFIALVDRQTIDGAFFRYGTLYAARFVNHGKELNAIAFADADGEVGYYDLEGAPLKKEFLKSPLKFSRITSTFSASRFHPIAKRRMPHYGVDYGAPVGTPAHVTASGTVTFVGRNGGAGNMVRVRHSNGYETNYLHLSRFAKGIRPGVRVSQGQVIGYVGATGWATGPHLDYRVKLNGRWINPLTLSSPPAEPLSHELLSRFLAHALALLEVLEGHDAPAGARC